MAILGTRILVHFDVHQHSHEFTNVRISDYSISLRNTAGREVSFKWQSCRSPFRNAIANFFGTIAMLSQQIDSFV